MKHTIGKLKLILVLLALATSCTKEIEYNLLKGNLEGVVYSNGDYSDISAKVLLEGNDLSKTTTTNSSGWYSFTGLPTGTYNLKFSQEGFSTFYIYGFPFIGGDSITETVPFVNLAQLPNASVSDLTMTMSVDTTYIRNYKIVNKTIDWTADFFVNDSSSVRYMAYLSSNANVSYKNYLRHYFAEEGSNLHLDDYDAILFREKTTLYMIIYPYSTLGSKYPDMDTGCLVYSGIQTKGASNVASVVVK